MLSQHYKLNNRLKICLFLQFKQSPPHRGQTLLLKMGYILYFPQNLYLGLRWERDVESLQNFSLWFCHLSEDVAVLAGVLHFSQRPHFLQKLA